MIEGLALQYGMGNSFNVEKFKPATANATDVMRFNMTLSNKLGTLEPQSNLLQETKVDIKATSMDNNTQDLLQYKAASRPENPLIHMDKSYRAIMGQIRDVPQFDKFLEFIPKNDTPAIRTNAEPTLRTKDPTKNFEALIAETRDIYKTAGSFSKDISKWHIKTQIWSANLKVLTTVVSQASQGFKTLFRSSG